MKSRGFKYFVRSSVKDVCAECNLIITATASKVPIIFKDYILPGTHITAVGADAIGKRELGSRVISLANTVVADSIQQCVERGEISYALSEKEIRKEQIFKLGNILLGKSSGRLNSNDITVVDLTGVAVQDIQIATAIFELYLEKKNEI